MAPVSRATGPRQFQLHTYGAGSKRLGRGEKEAEWPHFRAPHPPDNSHCAPTVIEQKRRQAPQDENRRALRSAWAIFCGSARRSLFFAAMGRCSLLCPRRSSRAKLFALETEPETWLHFPFLKMIW